MEIATQFEKMIAYCDRIVLAPYLRDRLRQQFNYFRLQALCDHDRRDNKRVIAMHWEMMKHTRHGRYIIEKFAADPTSWRPVAAFVSDTERYPVRPIRIDSQPLSTNTGGNQGLLPADFFAHLLRDFVRANPDPNPKRNQTPIQDQGVVIRLGLHYLIAEAKLRKIDRNPTAIKAVWKLLWPSLERLGLLKRFRNDTILKSRVQNFIANGFCIETAGGKSIESIAKPVRRGDPDCDYTGRRGINPRELESPRKSDPRLVVYEDVHKGYCPPTARAFSRPQI